MSAGRIVLASQLCLAMACVSSVEWSATSDEAAIYAAVIESAFTRPDGGRLYISADHERAGPHAWDTFFRAFPDANGLIQCSAIGFDAARRRALVVVGVGSSRRRGWGATFYPEMRDDGWQVVERVTEYIV